MQKEVIFLALFFGINLSMIYGVESPISHWQFDSVLHDSVDATSLQNSSPIRLCTGDISDYCYSSDQKIGNLNFIDGIIDKAHNFDGYTWFTTPQNMEAKFDLDINDPKSFAFWYRADEWTGHMYIITKKGDLENSHKIGYSIGVTEDGKIWYEQRSLTEILYARTSFDSSSKNKWTHVVITDEGTGNIDDISFYIDGIQASTDPKEVASTLDRMSTSILNDEPLFIGSFRGWHGWNYIGDIDDVKIFDYALSNDEVKSLYLKYVVPESESSPLQQIKSGIPISEIRCEPYLQLIQNSAKDKPACVTSYTAFRLLNLGW